jgi:uncharacterized membrane protein
MMPGRRSALAATFIVALLTAVTAPLPVPQAIRIALGILVVFVLPGFATVAALFPEGRLSRDECLIAILGISVAASVGAAVLLAATPAGLSRASFALLLGGATAVVSLYAWFRKVRDDRMLDADRDTDIREPHHDANFREPHHDANFREPHHDANFREPY